jgi:uracil-DNA glycosylase family 4
MHNPSWTPAQRAVLAELGIELWASRRANDIAEHSTDIAVAETALPDVAPAVVNEWQTLNTAIRDCTKCELHASRTQAVCGVGNQQADWLIVGEAPGADEDRQGEPFVGKAGQLLNEMLRAVGLGREQVFIANILKCRPPENRDPKKEEAEQCLPYLQQQIELLKPRLILVVGKIAAHKLLGVDAALGKLRGTVHRYGDANIPVVVTYHPAYLLRSPAQKRKSWEDLLLAMEVATEAGG